MTDALAYELDERELRPKPALTHRVKIRFGVSALRMRVGLYTSLQMQHVRTARDICKANNLPERALVICIATMMTESNIKVYANGNNPLSMRLYHEAVGWDHGSVGPYQQQPGGVPNSTANWGTTADCMDPAKSTGKFIRALIRFNWQAETNWDAAQRVQGSFDPTGGNYKRNDAAARALAAQLWAEAPPTPTNKDVDMKKLLRYTGKGVKDTAAVYYSVNNLQQRWVQDPADLAGIEAIIKEEGGDTAIHVTTYDRKYWGVLVGPDPESA